MSQKQEDAWARRQAYPGFIHPWTGKKHSAKTKKKMSKSRKLNSNGFRKGYRHSNETKLKIAEALRGRHLTDQAKEKFAFMKYAPVTTISAKTGKRVESLYDMIEAVYNSCCIRVPTGILNDILNDAMAMVQPPSDRGKRLKIFYITQASIKPPTFVLFVNNKDLLHFSYQRYIENQLREAFGFYGTPVRFFVRERKREK